MSLKNDQFCGAKVVKKDGSVVEYDSDGKIIKDKDASKK